MVGHAGSLHVCQCKRCMRSERSVCLCLDHGFRLPLCAPLPLALVLVPLLLLAVVALLIGLAAADVVAAPLLRAAAVVSLPDCSEWPVVLANTFLRRSSSAFRSAS